MSTLTTVLQYQSLSSAIILPSTGSHISYSDIRKQISALQVSLAEIGLSPGLAVTMSLVNGIEFALSFLSIGAQGAIAAPLNPAYKESEVEFYVNDIKAALMIVPRGAFKSNSPAVRGARKFSAGIAEIWWDGGAIRLDLKENGKRLKPKQNIVQAQADNVAVQIS